MNRGVLCRIHQKEEDKKIRSYPSRKDRIARESKSVSNRTHTISDMIGEICREVHEESENQDIQETTALIRNGHTDIAPNNRTGRMCDSARYLNMYARSNRV